jgi:hypothetical protein
MMRTLILLAVTIACSVAVAKPPAVWLSGGDGSSVAKAIVVHAPNESAGVDAEHSYVEQHFGKPTSINIELYQDKKRGLFDVFRFTGRDGKKHTIYFDTNSYFGR